VVEVHETLRAELRRLADEQARLREELAVLARHVPGQASASGAAVCATADTPDGTLDHGGALGSFYVEFEDRFRGTRESIKARQRPYLAHVRQATVGRKVACCVDIGCGRGEWLELLADEGFAAVGLDLDPGMVLAARQTGLDARIGDGIAWLELQPEASVDVITAFHVIEHLSFERVVRLLDAALRAVAPNGVVIFETPNPENLMVATNGFYLDPTHRRPIPPPLAEFLARQRGFPRVELLSLNPLPIEMQVAGDDELTLRVNRLLYGAQDYALIAWKHRAEPAA
jgi:O-antigen chain-terminating methyltransferase